MNRNYVVGTGVVGTTIALAIGIWTAFGPSGLSEPNWGLHIVIFNVGQADAIAMVAPNGQTAVIDAGQGSSAAARITEFLSDEEENGVGVIEVVKLGFVTHYDLDHMGGFDPLINSGIDISSVYDQGPSLKRSENNAVRYKEYISAVGDLNDNMLDDDDPNGNVFVRKRARVGLHWKLGDARIRCLAARGDTKGRSHDVPDLDPSEPGVDDENPGSIALLVTLGDFEFYTSGDQTSDDWNNKPDTEISVVDSGVLGRENDIDVLKVNHHGSDTSTGEAFIDALDPEVAIITSEYHSRHKLPKMLSIKKLVENDALVYVTGDGHNPQTGTFAYSKHEEDDDYDPPENRVFNDAGDIHIFVSSDGLRYRVIGAGVWREFSSVDSDNLRQ